MKHNKDLANVFLDYYNQSMYYTSKKIDNLDEFIEAERSYLKSKGDDK